MHLNTADRVDHEAFRRLAVVLIMLAGITESVADRSAPVRGIVLWLLCRAEMRVRDLALRTGGEALITSVSAASPVCLSGGSGEATRLVQRFRGLAAVFFALSRQAPQWLRMGRRYDPVRPFANRWNPLGPGQHQLSFTDTS